MLPATCNRAGAARGSKRNLTREEAAKYLGLGLRTLDNWRSQGRGPRYLKLGSRVIYPLQELDAFKAANLRQSTAETKRAA